MTLRDSCIARFCVHEKLVHHLPHVRRDILHAVKLRPHSLHFGGNLFVRAKRVLPFARQDAVLRVVQFRIKLAFIGGLII